MSRLFNSCNVVAFRNHVNDTRRVIFATLYYGLQLLLVHHCIVDVVFTGILREAAEINLNIFADICVQFVRWHLLFQSLTMVSVFACNACACIYTVIRKSRPLNQFVSVNDAITRDIKSRVSNWIFWDLFGSRLGLYRIWFFQIRPGPNLAGFGIADPAGAGAECSWAGGLGYIT